MADRKKLGVGGRVSWIALYLLLVTHSTAAFATSVVSERRLTVLAPCGSDEREPLGESAPRRICPEPSARHYSPHHQGLGYQVLDLESEACFVPDSAYALLDDIVDQAIARLSPAVRSGTGISPEARALAVSRAVNAVTISMGFGIYVPTATLGDALVSRSGPGQPPRYIVDCDTGAMILMTVADVLKIPTALVEITLPSSSLHNYVRWSFPNGRHMDWDTNLRDRCQTPDGQPSFQGRALTRTETIGYAYTLRASLWTLQHAYDKAEADYQSAMHDRPDSPTAYNNFAWIVASTDWPGRAGLRTAALSAAQRAVALQEGSGDRRLTHSDIGNYKDTLACLYADDGDFRKAIATEQEAVDVVDSSELKNRLNAFKEPTPKNCIGLPSGI